MGEPETQLRQAVRELRLRLHMSQTEFADVIGKSYPMIRRYEIEKAPQGEANAPFALAAIRHGYDDLAKIFRDAMIRDLGPEVVEVLIWNTGRETNELDIPQNLVPLVRALLDLYSRKSTPIAEKFKALLPDMLLTEMFHESGNLDSDKTKKGKSLGRKAR